MSAGADESKPNQKERTMKKSLALVAGIAALLLAAATVRTLAADESVTIKGEGKCAKCRSEEHTSELQSQSNLVCRLLLEKKKKKYTTDVLHSNEQYNLHDETCS